MKAKQTYRVGLVAAVTALFAAQANAVVENKTGNDGEALSAEATFVVNGSGNLEITLTNLGTYDPNNAPDILTAVLFDISGNPSLTAISGFLAGGSTLKNGTTPGDGAIGNQWAFAGGLSGTPSGEDYGISAVGFGLFGPGDLFPNGTLPDDGGSAPDGVAYGLTTSNDGTGNDNGSISGRALIDNSATFTLDVPDGFSVDQISNVHFLYGTSLTEVPNIPEPTGFILATMGLSLFGVLRRKHA